MYTKKRKIANIIAVMLVFLLALSVVTLITTKKQNASAAKLPDIGVDATWFGAEINFQEKTISSGETHQFYNYENGCVYVFINASNEVRSKIIFGGENYTVNLNDITSDKAITSSKLKDYTNAVDILELVGKEDATTAKSDVEKLLPEGVEYTDLQKLFKDKYNAVKDKFNIGVPSSGIKLWDGFIFQDFNYGDSTASLPFGARGTNYVGLCYSIESNNVYFIKDGYAKTFESLGSGKSDLGDILSDSGDKISPKDMKEMEVSLFAQGYIYRDRNDYISVFESRYDHVNKVFIAVPALLKDYGKETSTLIEKDSVFYQNFENGYVQYYLANNKFIYKNFANRNIDSNLNVIMVDKAVYLSVAKDRNVLTSGSDNVGIIIKDLDEAKKAKLKTDILLAVETTVTIDKKGVGVCISDIKHWDGHIVLEFKDGDGYFQQDSSRRRMSLIVYNPVVESAFAVVDYAKIWGGDAKSVLGNPKSAVFSEKIIKVLGETKTYKTFQEFDNGFIYTTDSGFVMVEREFKYDAEKEGFVLSAAPLIPSVFGKEISRKSNNDNVYINYEKACVSAIVNKDKTGFNYTTHAGRTFDEKFKPILLPLEDLLDIADIKIDEQTDFGIEKPKLIEMVFQTFAEYYAKGYFLGFLEDKIKPWNDIDAQQFIHGDSRANPFNDNRTNVCALALYVNRDLPVDDEERANLYLIADENLDVWEQNYSNLKFPRGDSEENKSLGIYIQEFSSGIIVREGRVAYYSSKTKANFISEYKKNNAPTHNNNAKDGFIDQDVNAVSSTGCSGAVNAGSVIVMGISVLLAGAFIVKRQRSSFRTRGKK